MLAGDQMEDYDFDEFENEKIVTPSNSFTNQVKRKTTKSPSVSSILSTEEEEYYDAAENRLTKPRSSKSSIEQPTERPLKSHVMVLTTTHKEPYSGADKTKTYSIRHFTPISSVAPIPGSSPLPKETDLTDIEGTRLRKISPSKTTKKPLSSTSKPLGEYISSEKVSVKIAGSSTMRFLSKRTSKATTKHLPYVTAPAKETGRITLTPPREHILKRRIYKETSEVPLNKTTTTTADTEHYGILQRKTQEANKSEIQHLKESRPEKITYSTTANPHIESSKGAIKSSMVFITAASTTIPRSAGSSPEQQKYHDDKVNFGSPKYTLATLTPLDKETKLASMKTSTTLKPTSFGIKELEYNDIEEIPPSRKPLVDRAKTIRKGTTKRLMQNVDYYDEQHINVGKKVTQSKNNEKKVSLPSPRDTTVQPTPLVKKSQKHSDDDKNAIKLHHDDIKKIVPVPSLRFLTTRPPITIKTTLQTIKKSTVAQDKSITPPTERVFTLFIRPKISRVIETTDIVKQDKEVKSAIKTKGDHFTHKPSKKDIPLTLESKHMLSTISGEYYDYEEQSVPEKLLMGHPKTAKVYTFSTKVTPAKDKESSVQYTSFTSPKVTISPKLSSNTIDYSVPTGKHSLKTTHMENSRVSTSTPSPDWDYFDYSDEPEGKRKINSYEKHELRSTVEIFPKNKPAITKGYGVTKRITQPSKRAYKEEEATKTITLTIPERKTSTPPTKKKKSYHTYYDYDEEITRNKKTKIRTDSDISRRRKTSRFEDSSEYQESDDYLIIDERKEEERKKIRPKIKQRLTSTRPTKLPVSSPSISDEQEYETESKPTNSDNEQEYPKRDETGKLTLVPARRGLPRGTKRKLIIKYSQKPRHARVLKKDSAGYTAGKTPKRMRTQIRTRNTDDKLQAKKPLKPVDEEEEIVYYEEEDQNITEEQNRNTLTINKNLVGFLADDEAKSVEYADFDDTEYVRHPKNLRSKLHRNSAIGITQETQSTNRSNSMLSFFEGLGNTLRMERNVTTSDERHLVSAVQFGAVTFVKALRAILGLDTFRVSGTIEGKVTSLLQNVSSQSVINTIYTNATSGTDKKVHASKNFKNAKNVASSGVYKDIVKEWIVSPNKNLRSWNKEQRKPAKQIAHVKMDESDYADYELWKTPEESSKLNDRSSPRKTSNTAYNAEINHHASGKDNKDKEESDEISEQVEFSEIKSKEGPGRSILTKQTSNSNEVRRKIIRRFPKRKIRRKIVKKVI